jgi:GTP cyclohydrolase I
MSKKRVVLLEDEEVLALLNAARVCIKMREDGASYFQNLTPAVDTAFEKLMKKKEEIDREL